MAVAPPLNVFIVGFIFLLVVLHLLVHVSCKAGFSDELINRDSPKSHPASTPLSRLHSSIRRSASYADYLRTANPGNANSPIVSINNEGGGANNEDGGAHPADNTKGWSAMVTRYYSHYLVSFKIGYYDDKVSVILEVAEDFIWLFCKPCSTCSADRPIFNSSYSQSYYKWDCKHEYCELLKKHNCDDEHKCRFSHKYNSGTVNGTLSKDTVTMRSINQKRDFHLEHVIFGCTSAIEGNRIKDSIGVLGLGSGPFSLVSQMGVLGYTKRFSYCLPNNNSYSSYLYFGSAAKHYGSTIWTSFHKINLTGIYVGSTGDHRRPTVDNIVISTSIFYTYIGEDSLEFIREQVMQRVKLPQITHEGYAICYDTSNAPVIFKMPEINLIFMRNAKLVLEEDNAFVRVDNALCLAILSNEHTSGTSVLGSLAQKGKHMLFDVEEGGLSFSHHNNHC